jgi:hypothetical protein
MQTGLRKMQGLGMWKLAYFEGLNAVEKSSGGFRGVGISIHHGAGLTRGIPFLAAGDTGMAADAGVEIYDECELCHFPNPLTKACHLPRAGSMPGTRGWVGNWGDVCSGSASSAF